MQIIPTDGIIATSPSVINIDAEEIEDAVVLDDIDPDTTLTQKKSKTQWYWTTSIRTTTRTLSRATPRR